MAVYHIYVGGEDKGIYKAATEIDALNEFAGEKGYNDWNEASELNLAHYVSGEIEKPNMLDEMLGNMDDRIAIKIDGRIPNFGGDFVCYKHDENWNILAALYKTSFVTGDRYFLLANGQPRQFISAEDAAEIERKNG